MDFPPNSSTSVTQQEAPADQELRILVADDVQVNQMVAVAILERLGYRADVVENGLEAIEALQAKPYDLIMMDICMPEMDGLEATRHIRDMMGSTIKPWIVAVTAHAVLGDEDKCLEAGMNDYVTKPISMKTIAAAINRCKQNL